MAERVPIGADMTAGELHDTLAQLGADLMVRALGALGARHAAAHAAAGGRASPMPAKIDKAETRIDWAKPWKAVHDHIRGLSPFPGAWCELRRAGAREGVAHDARARAAARPARCSTTGSPSPAARARCRIVELQRAGGKAMKADEFLRGTPVTRGDAKLG